jgi:serine/threonine protein kinase
VEGTPFGRYRLVEVLGRGGMGEVWRAFDTAMNRVVALKVLPANLADDDQYQARFRREAQVAAGLDEPHVVPIHDFGEIDGRLYVTMRLIDGKTIHELLADGPLAPARAVAIIEQIAAALNAAHRVGLVHRDVKPSNILVTEDDFAYLIDFGIARAAGATKLTSTGTTVGTLAYMAPERFTSDRTDASSDTYALTCVLLECLTGSQPFPGDSVERQLAGHLTMPPPRPSTMRPGVSPQMDQVIATGMAKKPEDRYATTKEMAAAARAALAMPAAPSVLSSPASVEYPNTAPYVPSALAASTHGAPAGPAPWPPMPMPDWQPAQSGPPWWRSPAILITAGLLGAIVVLAIVAAVLVIGWQGKSSNGHGSASTSAQYRPSAPGTISAAPDTNSSVPVPTTSAPKGPAQLQTADGLNGLLATLRTKFGDTMGYRLVVYPDYAIADRADPKNSHVKQSYMYRDGAWTSWAPDMTTASFDILADLGAINVTAVTATLAGAPAALGAPDGTQTYLIVEGAEGGGLELAIHSTAAGTGYMQVNADGSVKRVIPP